MPPTPPTPTSLSTKGMVELFPFHIAIDETLKIVQYGSKLPILVPDIKLGVLLMDIFTIERPVTEPSLKNFILAQDQQFLLRMKSKDATLLRGQFFDDGPGAGKYLILNPFITDNKELVQSGLTLSDIPLHDSLGDTLVLLQAKAIALADAQQLAKKIESRTARYRALIQSSSDAIVVIDREMKITYASPAMENILGRDKTSFLGQDFTSIMDKEDRASFRALLAQEAREHGSSVSLQFTVMHPNTGVRTLHATATNASETPEVSGYILNVNDSTKLLDLQGKLSKFKKMESLGRMAGGFAHEFNNILSIILNYAQFVEEAIPSKEDRIHRDIQKIITAGNRAAELTKRVLNFSRNNYTEATSFSLTDLVRKIEGRLQKLSPQNIALSYQYTTDDLCISADPEQLNQVIINLVNNACESFMNEAGTVQVEVGSKNIMEPIVDVEGNPVAFGRYIFLSVNDFGCGISKEDQDQLFEPFFTKGKTKQGRGLGLATVFGIAYQYKAQIILESSPGQGSEFQILFQPQGGVGTAAFENSGQLDAPAESTRIVVVDDYENLCYLMTRFLEVDGYIVTGFSNPLEALDYIVKEGSELALVVSDVVMPTLSGPDLAAQIKEVHPQIPFLFVSGFTEGNLQEDENFTPEFFLPKPFSHDDLTQAVANAVAKSQKEIFRE
ncbi:MAG: PAS domain S-box protein [Planctomycetes bacterium]|nr:PAS domain S-box protein [Planctomycetota bacterium]